MFAYRFSNVDRFCKIYNSVTAVLQGDSLPETTSNLREIKYLQ
jgi:hypothetical protein